MGNFILTQFTTSEIKRYLQYPPPECTILFEVDDALKDIPWELMLETAYAGRDSLSGSDAASSASSRTLSAEWCAGPAKSRRS